MRLNKIIIAAALLVVAVGTKAQMPEGMEIPKAPVDPEVRMGKLDNGLTYYIRHNNYPEHQANFYIAQRVGSIQEEEEQRGLAHFLEHMCFNGTEHFPGNEVIRWLETKGVQFGSQLNAYTSIDRTFYNINNVPTANVSTLDSCLLILKDWSNGLTLDAKEIDDERGVIHEEWRLRTSASSRMFERNLETLYPGSKYGKRYPIGLMSVVDNFKPDTLRAYYRKWYRPDNQAIIVVGDVDVDRTEAKIKEMFGVIPAPAADAAQVVDEQVPDNEEPIVVVDKDKEMQYNVIQVMFKSEAFPVQLRNTQVYLVNNYTIDLITSILNQRLSEKAQEADCPFLQAAVSYGQYIFAKTKNALNLVVVPKEGQESAAVSAAFRELLRAAQYGLTATEYERAKSEYLSSLDKAYENRNQRDNDRFGRELGENFFMNDPIPSIEQLRTTMQGVVPMIQLNLINQSLSQNFLPKDNRNLVIISFNHEQEGKVYPTAEALLQGINSVRQEKLEAFVDNVKSEPLMTVMPQPGKIKKESTNAKLGYKELTLSNGAKVLLKQTKFKEGEVLIGAMSNGGQSVYGPADYTNLKVFSEALSMSGLGNFNNTELTKALAGKQVSMNFSLTKGMEVLNGHSTPKDLETAFQLIYLSFTARNKDQKAFDNLMAQLDMALKNRDIVPDAALADSITETRNCHNPRFSNLKHADLANVNYDRILQMAAERTANAADYTFYFVGNFEEDSIKPLICQYIASLPAQGKKDKVKDINTYPKGNVKNEFTRKQETPKATAMMLWRADKIPFTLENDILADVAGQILDMVYLKKIREEESAAYTVTARGAGNFEMNKNHVTILGYCPMKPEKKDVALRLMREEAKNLTVSIDGDMLAKVKEYMLKQADEDAKTNSHWVNVLTNYYIDKVDIHTDYKKIVESLTPAKISAFVKKVMDEGNHVEVIMLPEE